MSIPCRFFYVHSTFYTSKWPIAKRIAPYQITTRLSLITGARLNFTNAFSNGNSKWQLYVTVNLESETPGARLFDGGDEWVLSTPWSIVESDLT